jgi:hypothetical protein
MTRLLVTASAVVLALASFANAQTPVPPVAGDIAVTEIMFNPGPDACVPDINGEYFEIMNISNNLLDLNGIYIEDRNTTTGLPSGFGFQVLASVATLPPLYPGQRFVFARDTGAPFGLIPNVVYDYAVVTGPAPLDKSQVSSTGMMINNTGVDGLFIATGAFASLGGTVIEAVSYNSSAAPLLSNVGVSVERIDIFAPWAVSGVGNDNNNCAQPLLTATYGNPDGIMCTGMQRGTPGAVNSVDTTGLWPRHQVYDSVLFPNIGTITCVGPVSINAGSATFNVTDGGNGLNGLPYYLGYSDDVPGEYPIALFIPGNPGSFVIDLVSSAYLPAALFDGAGAGTSVVAVPPNPLLIGVKFQLQWIAVGTSPVIVLSHGLRITVSP